MTGSKDDKRNTKKASKETRREAQGEGPSVPGVDLDQIERLVEFMGEHDLEEFEYESGGLRIRLRKGGSNPRSGSRPSAARQVAPAPPEAPAAPGPPVAVTAPDPPPAAPPAEELHIIKSPIVGTFYSAPSPETPAFVKVGDEIAVGQVVCIIEAMKLMNEIEADAKGELVRVLVENAQPVEYGQPLFAIRAATKKK